MNMNMNMKCKDSSYFTPNTQVVYKTRIIFPILKRHTSLFHNSMVLPHRLGVVTYSGKLSKFVEIVIFPNSAKMLAVREKCYG